jgi:nitrogen regulatory protein PII-like uncharacterized protein
MSEDSNRNEHRKSKHSFQAFQTTEEKEVLITVKKIRGIKQNTVLLNTLLQEEKERLLKE